MFTSCIYDTLNDLSKEFRLQREKNGTNQHFSIFFFFLNDQARSRIKKIPYQAPPTQLGPQKSTFWKRAFLGPKYQC